MDQKSNNSLKEGIIKFLTISGDLIVLNLLWIVCSIPIVTIGPTTNALFDVCLRIAEDDDTVILKRFFQTFKKNFKQSLIVGVLSIFIIITLYADVRYIFAIEGSLQKIYIVVAFIVLAILLTIITYVNCLIAKYDNTLKEHFINAFKLVFICPLQTILVWLIILSPILMAIFIQPIILLYMGGLILMFAVSLPVYLCCVVINGVFKKVESSKGNRT